MKKQMIYLVVLSTLLTGCSKVQLTEVVKATTNATTYDYTVLEKETLEGSVTLEPGQYLVVSNEGANCVISDGETKEMFSEREYIAVSESVAVTITDGYLMKEEDAPALNGSNYNQGVYLIGKDLTPRVYSNKGSWFAYNSITQQYETVDIKYLEAVPELFSNTVPNSLTQSSKIEFTDSMLVLLTKNYMEESAIWDVDEAVEKFFGSYQDTSVDALREEYGIVTTVDTALGGSSSGISKEAYTGETKSFQTKSGNKYLLKSADTTKQAAYIISTTSVNLPLDRMWVNCETDLTGSLSNVNIYKKSDVTVKLNLSTDKLISDSQYLSGVDFKSGAYKISGGSVTVSKSYSSMLYDKVTLSDNYVTYSDGDIVTLVDEDLVTVSSNDITLTKQE